MSPERKRVFLAPNLSMQAMYSDLPDYQPRLRRRVLQVIVYVLFGVGYAAALYLLVWIQA